jgi:hypothetical protein
MGKLIAAEDKENMHSHTHTHLALPYVRVKIDAIYEYRNSL